MTQCEKIKAYLDRYGSITQREAYSLGCMRLAARIADLRAQGLNILMMLKTVVNADGSKSRVGVYYYG